MTDIMPRDEAVARLRAVALGLGMPSTTTIDTEVVRALLRRAHDAMSRREPDGVSDVEWDKLVADIAKELGL